jgi:hypothetical protein
MANLTEICNNNINNIPSQDVYNSFNNLVFNKDIKILGKLLHRFQFFEITKNLAGDIVELGVFKGSGMATFIKFINIYCPNSNKKVIGFDIFNSQNEIIDTYKNGSAMKQVYARCKNNELDFETVNNKLININNDQSKFILIQGDVCHTTKEFVNVNPGFRISLLYVDLDLNEPVYTSLKNLWDRILPGGYVIFDEYEFHKFDESTGVEKFLKEFNIEYEVTSTNWMGPTAYLIKKK